MTFLTPTMTRTAVAKTLGFLAGLAGFYATRSLMPGADPLLAWGVLALYLTIGGMIGLMGVIGQIPLLHLPLPAALRGGVMGAWMTLLVVLFGYDMIAAGLADMDFLPAFMASPWWMILDGMLVGAVIDMIASRLVKGVPDVYVAGEPTRI